MPTRRANPGVALLAILAGLAVTGCAVRIPEAPVDRRAMSVLFLEGGRCTHLTGPTRIGAYPGENVIFEVHNRCDRDVRFQVTKLTRTKRAGDEKGHDDPFERTSQRWVAVERGKDAPLVLRVRLDAVYGHYTYESELDGTPDADGELDIWPPR